MKSYTGFGLSAVSCIPAQINMCAYNEPLEHARIELDYNH